MKRFWLSFKQFLIIMFVAILCAFIASYFHIDRVGGVLLTGFFSALVSAIMKFQQLGPELAQSPKQRSASSVDVAKRKPRSFRWRPILVTILKILGILVVVVALVLGGIYLYLYFHFRL
ncbi:MAG TPA: hypothetical protein VNH18_12590 [Bryobacteraceae bacterium]|nr:hypothetical protein [Bryobacteraceae bacterium]